MFIQKNSRAYLGPMRERKVKLLACQILLYPKFICSFKQHLLSNNYVLNTVHIWDALVNLTHKNTLTWSFGFKRFRQ
jgi:hypothetical protein